MAKWSVANLSSRSTPKQSSCVSCPSAELHVESGLPSPINRFHYEKSLASLFHIENYYEFLCTTFTHVTILTLPRFLDEDVLSVDRNHLNVLLKPYYFSVNLGNHIFCCSVVTFRFICHICFTSALETNAIKLYSLSLIA